MQCIYLVDTNSKLLHTMKCACCGADMLQDKELENTIIYKCKECGLTDSRLKDIGESMMFLFGDDIFRYP
jgi:hypothetical protein